MSIRVQIVTQQANPISAAIRFTTRSWASHAEFINLEINATLGSRSAGGVRLRDCKSDRYSRVEQFTAAGIEEAYRWAMGQIYKPYDYSAIAGIALNRNWRDERRWFCSELVAAAFEQVGHPLLSTRPSAAVYRVTPRDLLLSRMLYFLPTA